MCIYDVWRLLDVAQEHQQSVILLADGSYLCTCLQLQNSGVVCRHFFYLMREDCRFKYHISLIPRRWHRERARVSGQSIALEPFSVARTHPQPYEPECPSRTYMSDVRRLFPLTSPTSLLDERELSRKKRRAELSCKLKALQQMADDDSDEYESIMESLDEVIVQAQGIILNPPQKETKGRPRVKRYKNSSETKERTLRCTTCGLSGHNKRFHNKEEKK